jgi:hypothetical protein
MQTVLGGGWRGEGEKHQNTKEKKKKKTQNNIFLKQTSFIILCISINLLFYCMYIWTMFLNSLYMKFHENFLM